MGLLSTYPYDSDDDEAVMPQRINGTRSSLRQKPGRHSRLRACSAAGAVVELPREDQSTQEAPIEVALDSACNTCFVLGAWEDESQSTSKATMFPSYNQQPLYNKDTMSSDGQSTQEPSTEVPADDGTTSNFDIGRVYEKSGRRMRRSRRRKLWMLLGALGFVTMMGSLAIGLWNSQTTKALVSRQVVAPEDVSPTSQSDTIPSELKPSNPTGPPVTLSIPPPQSNPIPSDATDPSSPPVARTAPPSPPVAPSPVAPPPVAPAPVAPPPRDVSDPVTVIQTEFPQGVVIASNRFLEVGDFISSPSGEFRAGLDESGNLILEDSSFNILWSAGITGGHRAFMQSDGNLIVRNRDRRALWTSETYDHEGSILVVDDGGRIAVMDGNTPVWLDGLPRGTYDGPSSKNLDLPVRGIFYYPWFPETWTVNGKLAKFEPDLGFYSSSSPEIAEAHIDAMDYGLVDLSIASWWGPGTNLDRARLSMLMDKTIQMGSSLKWTIYHEDERKGRPSTELIRSDLDYLKKWFAWHPAWAHVNGRPVIFVFNAGGCDIVDRWMSASNGDWYVVLKIFSKFWECPSQPDHWHQYGVNSGEPLQYIGYSFSLAPGFWKADEAAPRTERVEEDEWCENVQFMASSGEPWQLIISFNEAGEGTNIEPASNWTSDTDYGYYLDCLNEYPTLK